MSALGINERAGVNIIGFNSPEWAISFIGGIFYNCVSTGVYITNTPEACFYQADHSEAEIVICDGIDQLKKYTCNFHKFTKLKAIVVYNVDSIPNDVKDPRIFTWSDFMLKGSQVKDETILEKVNK